MTENEKKVLLSLKDVEVKFNVRGRILTAIRGVSLDIYENESIAIVGESGSGKSVLTKTFAGMLDSNGFVSKGRIIFSDDEITKTEVKLDDFNRSLLEKACVMLNKKSKLERGSAEFLAIQKKKDEIKHSKSLSLDEEAQYSSRIKSLSDDIVDKTNYFWTLDKKTQRDEYDKVSAEIKRLTEERNSTEKEKNDIASKRAKDYAADVKRQENDKKELDDLAALRNKKMETAENPSNPEGLSDAVIERNKNLAYEIVLSIGRFPGRVKNGYFKKLEKAFEIAMCTGEDLSDEAILNDLFEPVGFRVRFEFFDEKNAVIHGTAISRNNYRKADHDRYIEAPALHSGTGQDTCS